MQARRGWWGGKVDTGRVVRLDAGALQPTPHPAGFQVGNLLQPEVVREMCDQHVARIFEHARDLGASVWRQLARKVNAQEHRPELLCSESADPRRRLQTKVIPLHFAVLTVPVHVPVVLPPDNERVMKMRHEIRARAHHGGPDLTRFFGRLARLEGCILLLARTCSRKRAVNVFGWVFLIFLISPAHLHVPPWGVRADERAESDWPPWGWN